MNILKKQIVLIFALGINLLAVAQTTKEDNYETGVKIVNEVNGEGAAKGLEAAFKSVSPDMAEYIIRYGFGEIYNRPGLDFKTKELLIIASLTTQANATSQLKSHMKAALNVGVTPNEISETMILLSLYTGFPAANNGIFALKEVLSEVNYTETAKTNATDKLTKNWELTGFSMPESIVASATENWLYVSNVNKNEKGYISRITKDGKVDNYNWVTGLNNPAGLALYQDKLYVGDGTELHIIDVKKGKIIESIASKEAMALNDVAISKEGQVFVSDIATGKIFTLENNKLVVWFQAPEIMHPNGLFVDGDYLVIANFGAELSLSLTADKYGSMYKVNLKDKTFSMLKSSYQLGALDGLAVVKEGYLVTGGTVSDLFFINDNAKKLVGTFPKGLADISIQGNTLYAPILFSDKIESFSLPKDLSTSKVVDEK
ncbi:carboxymuconolactone decarboxylase family protein [Frigoriflavimonas asaccharolytica]|uniref:Alkylhydroperoxidase/carboxymuconolactone decarboxylase family protein YurZ/sugar lactone lactonase YvrE n=1 Tax=Frigoriflavimonas asaccharolytica TaxID=2735899 RepID=A0A8J8G8Y2_9FLAO|nr:carboxymuconolactone decarboxylase family protein [Frigoriflavimonas asaccharolytica]NRS92127.1 alkylhydroperoxidase/carboxymuconolactone decarboxylase family protein YurZ/sugar lactone lactonase YvrE [Frigoriflavimonas asaccharolytica]